MFFLGNPERKLGHVGDEADILKDLGPADVKVLLQAEEELGQVPLMSQCFTSARNIISNKADVTICYTRLNLICQISLPFLCPVPAMGESVSQIRLLS